MASLSFRTVVVSTTVVISVLGFGVMVFTGVLILYALRGGSLWVDVLVERETVLTGFEVY